jgi:hypothetical protein
MLLLGHSRHHADLVSLAIAAGADPNYRNPETLETALHALANSEGPATRSHEGVRAMLAAGANPKAKQRDGSTALDLLLVNSYFGRAEREAIVTTIEAAGGTRNHSGARSLLLSLLGCLLVISTVLQLSALPFVVKNPWPEAYSELQGFFRFMNFTYEKLGIFSYRILVIIIIAMCSGFTLLSLLYRAPRNTKGARAKAMLLVLVPLGLFFCVMNFIPTFRALVGLVQCNAATGALERDPTVICWSWRHIVMVVFGVGARTNPS